MNAEPVPYRMRHLRLFKGVPVPYTTLLVNDVPDFRITDIEAWQHVVDRRACAICGLLLEPVIYFIGGPAAINNRLFFDPPMHEECAKYSLRVCPFLNFRKGYRDGDFPEDSILVSVDPNMHTGRCDQFGLLATGGYGIYLGPGGKKYLRPHKAISVVWYDNPHSAAPLGQLKQAE